MIKDFEKIVEGKYKNIKVEYNYHTHNFLCGHAKGTVSDYVKEAIDKNLKVIGISDHGWAPVMEKKAYINLEDIDNLYLPQFEEAYKLYQDKIVIKKGLEIEYQEGFDYYYQELLKRFDYLILGQHHYYACGQHCLVFKDNKSCKEGIEYFDGLIKGAKSGYFKIIAHPDAILERFKRNRIPKKVEKKLEEFVNVCINRNIPIEINVNGYRSNHFKYPCDKLIEVVKKLNARIVIGSDCHEPSCLVDDATKKVYAYCISQGLNIAKIEQIDI